MAALTYESSSYQVRGARGDSEPAAFPGQSPITSIDLGDEILKVLKSNPIGLSPEGTYLPDDEYDRLLRKDRIQATLGGGREVSTLVEYVISSAKKTFATLLQVFYIYYDDSTISTAKCVIVGTDRYHANGAGMKKHYVLIVKPLSDILGATASYDRCGVGCILDKYIRLDKPSIYVSIE